MVLAALGAASPASAEAPRTNAPSTTSAEPSRSTAALFPTKITRETAGAGAAGEGAELVPIAGQLDVLLADAAQDLGLVLDLDQRGAAPDDEAELVALASSLGGTLIVPSVRARDGEIELRIVLAEASSPELRVRIERASRADVAVRAVVMLRDLVTGLRSTPARRSEPRRAPEGTLTYPAKSAGRTALGVNATLFGGLLGYSIQRASGSEDPRLLYPLLAVGAGGGLVMSILAAEEWDVSVGSAWFVASGAWWPTLAGHLIHAGRFGASGSEGEQWTAGLVAGMTGLTLSTLGLALRRGMSEGGALLAHTGGGLGLVLGGMTEALVLGNVDSLPIAGMGYGAGLGWLGAAALAVHWRPSAQRVVGMDLGALLGGLGGAALGSPLLLDGPTETQQRAWVGITGGMTLAGAAVGWLMTRPKAEAADKRKQAHSPVEATLPVFGVIGQSSVGERRAPVVGLSWSGALR